MIHKKYKFFSAQESKGFLTCSQCGVCCKLFLINLSEEEYKSKKYKTMFDEFVEDAQKSEISGIPENSEDEFSMDFEEAEMVGANVLAQKKDKSCIYLKDNKCSIHDFRPQSCKNFSCESKEERFKKMIETINKAKANKE